MVFYELLMTAKSTTHYYALTSLMKEISHTVVESGGIVRSIQNHGVRQLPHRFKAKYRDRNDDRYFERGRFVSLFYDASPGAMKRVTRIVDLNEEILRGTHLRASNVFDEVNNWMESKNPYVQEVIREVEEEERRRREEEEKGAGAEK